MLKSERYKLRFTEFLVLRNYSAKTIKSYCNAICCFFDFVRTKTKNGYSVHEYARRYLVSLHYNGSSWSKVNVHYSAIRLLFNIVLDKEWNYKMIPRPKNAKKLPVVLSHEEVGDLISAVKNHKHQTIIITLYSTGCRVSELLNFKVRDIDRKGLMIRVNNGKGARDRIIHVSARYMDILQAYMLRYQPRTYLFEGRSQKQGSVGRYSPNSVLKIISKAAEQAGIDKSVSAHTFRHSYATHNLDFGTNLEYLRRQLGHTSLKTTSQYLHLCRYKNQQLFHPIDHLKISLRGSPP